MKRPGLAPGRFFVSVTLRSEAAKPPSLEGSLTHRSFEARLRRAPQDDGRRDSSPVFFDRRRVRRIPNPVSATLESTEGARDALESRRTHGPRRLAATRHAEVRITASPPDPRRPAHGV